MIKGNSLPLYNNNDTETYASHLKKLRKDRTLTQQQVADKIGVTVKTYRTWEQDIELASTCYLIKLADLFNVSVDYLLNRSDFTSPENDYVGQVTGLSDSAINVLRDLPGMQIIINAMLTLDRSFRIINTFLATRKYTETPTINNMSVTDIKQYAFDTGVSSLFRDILTEKDVYNYFSRLESRNYWNITKESILEQYKNDPDMFKLEKMPEIMNLIDKQIEDAEKMTTDYWSLHGIKDNKDITHPFDTPPVEFDGKYGAVIYKHSFFKKDDIN